MNLSVERRSTRLGDYKIAYQKLDCNENAGADAVHLPLLYYVSVTISISASPALDISKFMVFPLIDKS